MQQALYHGIFIIAFSLSFIPAHSQSFYVNAWWNPNQDDNITYKFTVGKCDLPNDTFDMSIYTCQPRLSSFPSYTDSSFTDIAIDASQNLWYLALNGDLYVRKLDDTTSCRYVGSFLDTPATFSALVADNDGAIYTAGNRNNHSVLYKYNAATGFKYLGMLPKWVECSGDLFFYQRRLFMTCVDNRVDSYFVYEIALADPAQSCYYMPLPGMTLPWAAFSYQDVHKHRVYISSTDTVNHSTSRLMEIDMQNKKVLGSVCSYMFQIRGAAAYYNQTGDTTHCPIVPKSVVSISRHDEQLTVYNPSNQTIRINTSLNRQDIRTINLYDLYGKRARQYTVNDFPNYMYIADLADGLYILHIVTNDGRQWKEKVLVSDNV